MKKNTRQLTLKKVTLVELAPGKTRVAGGSGIGSCRCESYAWGCTDPVDRV